VISNKFHSKKQATTPFAHIIINKLDSYIMGRRVDNWHPLAKCSATKTKLVLGKVFVCFALWHISLTMTVSWLVYSRLIECAQIAETRQTITMHFSMQPQDFNNLCPSFIRNPSMFPVVSLQSLATVVSQSKQLIYRNCIQLICWNLTFYAKLHYQEFYNRWFTSLTC